MIAFARRNLKLFFRDKSAVFFSLLAVFIIIGLYALFLGDTLTDSLRDLPGARQLVDCWIMAGLLAVTSITTTMGAFGIMVNDRCQKIDKDFASSPIKKGSLAGGYLLSAYLIGVLMSFVALVLAQGYLLLSGGSWLEVSVLFQTVALILYTTLVSTSLVFFLVSFFKSQNAFATASTVIGTLIGFLTGIYLPMGQMPEAMQLVVKLFPVSHAAVLFRQVLMKSRLEEAFAQVPAGYEETFRETMGITFRFGDYTVTPAASLLFLLLTAVVFFCSLHPEPIEETPVNVPGRPERLGENLSAQKQTIAIQPPGRMAMVCFLFESFRIPGGRTARTTAWPEWLVRLSAPYIRGFEASSLRTEAPYATGEKAWDQEAVTFTYRLTLS